MQTYQPRALVQLEGSGKPAHAQDYAETSTKEGDCGESQIVLKFHWGYADRICLVENRAVDATRKAEGP
jgi:hypothetical protein